jgi:hypothetical protein
MHADTLNAKVSRRGRRRDSRVHWLDWGDTGCWVLGAGWVCEVGTSAGERANAVDGWMDGWMDDAYAVRGGLAENC